MPREHFSEDPADSVHFHCARCRRVFKDLRSRRCHVRKADCSPLATPTTVQLTSTHPGQGQQQHLTMNFDNLGQAEQWFLEQDLERTFTKRSTCDPSRTYVCRQAWNRDSAKRKKTKKLYECPARSAPSTGEETIPQSYHSLSLDVWPKSDPTLSESLFGVSLFVNVWSRSFKVSDVRIAIGTCKSWPILNILTRS